MKAVRIHEHGGPEVMRVDEIPTPKPGEGEILVRQEACGINYIDTYHRTGLYPIDLPRTLGLEAAGVVEAVGSGVTLFEPGDRVAYNGVPGGYAEYNVVPEAKGITLPDGVDAKHGAAALLQGMTAHYLAHSTYPLGPKDTCLIHAAAGGVGLLLVQMAKMRGARVLGTVSTGEKAKLAREAGADVVIRYTEQDFEEVVRTETGGKGLQVVYDSVGKTTFEKSLNSLAPLGMLVLFGQSSGKVPPFDATVLNQKGSLFLTRPSLFHYTPDRPSLEQRAGDVLGWIESGKLRLRIGETFALDDAVEAHRALEGRKTTGKVLLIP